MPGMPASETTAMRAPALSDSTSSVRAMALVVLVIADGGRGDGEVVEEFLGLAGIFAGDAVGVLEDFEGAESDVAEIADGRGDEVEAGGEFF